MPSSSNQRQRPKRQGRSTTTTYPPEIQKKLSQAWDGAQKTKGGTTLPIGRAIQVLQDFLQLDVESSELSSAASSSKQQIDRDAFFAMAGPKLIQNKKAARAFALFDQNEKGVVVLEDLQRIATELGESLSDSELQDMVDQVDQSGEGLLTVEDFVQIAKEVDL